MKPMSCDSTSQDVNILQAIERACEGLLFPSETDAPLQVLAPPNSAVDNSAPEEIPPEYASAKTSDQTLQEFFAPATNEADWMNQDERATAQRFQALVELLQSQLSEIRVLRTSDIPADIYIVGQHNAQTIVLKTQVVET